VTAGGSRSKVEPARTSDFPSSARRPVYSVLDNRRAAGLLGALPTWQEILGRISSP
jgi:dTDP-4-dehydrorhamnose reductase